MKKESSMKTVTSLFALGFSLNLLLAAQAPAPLKTIDLNKVKFQGASCSSKWRDGISRVIWVDEKHFAVFLFPVECSDAVANPKPAAEVAVFDSSGSLIAACRNDFISIFRGPRGTVVGLSWGKIELLDDQLRSLESMSCPDGSKSCGITLAPSSTFDSEFALCSAKDSQRRCDFYRNWPTVRVSSATIPEAEDPYTHLVVSGYSGYNAQWRVGSGETWSFSDGLLRRSSADGTSSLVSPEDFVGKNGGGCDGELSSAEPRRFLAVCAGTHWWSDGMFDSIFGFSRVVVFDVPSGRIISRIDGPAYTSASLSPSGKLIAVLRGNKVRLYQVG
jgi:hypothetical protein